MAGWVNRRLEGEIDGYWVKSKVLCIGVRMLEFGFLVSGLRDLGL